MIWVIGVSMIVLAVLIHLPMNASRLWLLMIAFHNLLDDFRVEELARAETPVPSIGAKALDLASPAV